jgi:hypothetical protein
MYFPLIAHAAPLAVIIENASKAGGPPARKAILSRSRAGNNRIRVIYLRVFVFISFFLSVP